MTAVYKRGGIELVYSMSTGPLTVTMGPDYPTQALKRDDDVLITVVPSSVLAEWERDPWKRGLDETAMVTPTPVPQAYFERDEIPQVMKRCNGRNTFVTMPSDRIPSPTR